MLASWRRSLLGTRLTAGLLESGWLVRGKGESVCGPRTCPRPVDRWGKESQLGAEVKNGVIGSITYFYASEESGDEDEVERVVEQLAGGSGASAGVTWFEIA